MYRGGLLMKRHTIIAIVSVLAIALIAVAVLTHRPARDTASSPAPADEETTAANSENAQNSNGSEPTGTDQAPSRKVNQINIYVSYSDWDLYQMIDAYAKKHWGNCYIKKYDGSIYYSQTDIHNMVKQSLLSGDGAVDVYVLDERLAPYYLKGEFSQYACTYKELGIDVENALKKADIPEYAVRRNPDGEVIALPYQSAAFAFLYRRSIARDVWGTDDPEKIAEIIGGGTQSWDKFIEAAKELKKHGYYIAPGYKHLMWMIDTSSYPALDYAQNQPNPLWEEYMDIAKYLVDNGYVSDFNDLFNNEWSNALEGPGSKVFGTVVFPDYFDADYFISETSGDWAICMPPFTTWYTGCIGIMVNKASPNKDVLGPLVEWITLDCSEEGAQYGLATGELVGRKVSVISGTVLKNVESRRDNLGGQDVNPIIYDIHQQPMVLYSGTSGFSYWLDAMEAYVTGEKDKESAIRQFRADLRKYGIRIDPYPEPATGPESPEDKVVVWKDKNLEAAIRDLLYTPTRDIYESDLRDILYLDLSGKSIKSLEDIVHFKNLRCLYLNSNNINDISYLKELKHLELLEISSNQITDISVLGELAELKELCISDNNIKDISVLKDLPLLERLEMGRIGISDISILREHTNLVYLDVSRNDISDISCLKDMPALEHLNISRNKISDISVLKGKPNLKYLDASQNSISNISYLSGSTHMESLNLSDNKITDISALKKMTKLTYLNLAFNAIRDIGSLRNMKDLEFLMLNGNQISDIRVLKNLENLWELNLRGNNITDISPAEHVINVLW